MKLKITEILDQINNEKPHERILFMLQAVRDIENHPKAAIDMGFFHQVVDPITSDHKICVSCAGGAAAIKRFGISPDELVAENVSDIADFTGLVQVKYNQETILYDVIEKYERSLNGARFGLIKPMFKCMKLSEDIGITFNRKITHYHTDRDQWFNEMNQLAQDLKEAGY